MTIPRKNPLLGFTELWLQRQRMRELQAQRLDAAQRQLLDEAKGASLVAWRVLGGLEPVPYAVRAAVALPLIASGLNAAARVLAPTSSVATLFDDPSWQARFTSSGLSAEQQQRVQQWWLNSEAVTHDLELARSGLTLLRAALDATSDVEREMRKIRRRRALIAAALVFIVLGAAGTVTWLRAPNGPPDLAAGKPWHSSSNYPGFSSAGSKPVRPIEGLFFSTNEEEEPWWQLDLEKSFQLGSVDVVNRSDCCADRAFPLVLELSSDGKKWHEVARQNDPFNVWEAKFTPRKARYVRLRALKRTLLHFRDVRVHAAR